MVRAEQQGYSLRFLAKPLQASPANCFLNPLKNNQLLCSELKLRIGFPSVGPPNQLLIGNLFFVHTHAFSFLREKEQQKTPYLVSVKIKFPVESVEALDRTGSTITIRWSVPPEAEGLIEKFEILFHPTDDPFDVDTLVVPGDLRQALIEGSQSLMGITLTYLLSSQISPLARNTA